MSKALKRVEVLLSHWGGNKTVVVSVADLREVVRLAKLALPTDWARVARDELKRIERGEPNSLGQVSTAKRGRKR